LAFPAHIQIHTRTRTHLYDIKHIYY